MKMRKIFILFNLLAVTLFFAGCAEKKDASSSDSKQQESSKKEDGSSKESSDDNAKIGSLITSGEVKDQLEKPQKGEEIAVFNVKDYGVIKARLFPQVAPNAVKNFKKLAKEGKYDGVSFHRVIENFMIQGGQECDEKLGIKTGTQVELNPSVHHFDGALCMARAQSKTDGQGSQFYFVSSQAGKSANFDDIQTKANANFKFEGLNMELKFDEATRKTYKKVGGYPELDMAYTVFGQAFEGQDVIKKIAACPKEESLNSGNPMGGEQNSKPKEPIIVEKVTIEKA